MADQGTMAELLRAPTEFDESFHVAWDRYKDLLRACPHYGFTELHQLDTFYNALNPADQDSLNATVGGNLLERRTQDVLTIIENKSKIAKLTHAVNQQTSAVTTAMMAILKQFKATPPPASMKAVEEICVTCGGAHAYYQCLAAGGNTFLEVEDNIQGYVLAAAVNYNQALLSNKEKLQKVANTPLNENCSAVILKKLPKKLGDPGKFLIPCGFNELKCKALSDLGASINLTPLSVWKKLGLPKLISTRMTLELANRAICLPVGIARDVFVPIGQFTFPTDFVIVDYESDPRVPLILGRPFLRTARALIDVHGEEMILRDGDERLTLNMRHDTLSYSNRPQKESINLINVFNNSKGGNVLHDKLLDLDSTKDLHPPLHVNPSSSPNQLLEELADELALITFPPKYDDDLQFDIESDLKEIEFRLHREIDSSLKDLIDQSNLADLNENLVDSMPEMFTDEHALDYSCSPIFDEYDDDLFDVESDTENVYDDHFDSKGEKIKEVDAKPSTNNKDKDKKLATSNASLVLEDFNPPLYELPFFKEVT
nr:reverse transcriptase domain-containing protein [Tanacetum cinerariifolium]